MICQPRCPFHELRVPGVPQVIGTVGLRRLAGLLRSLAEKVGREINPIILTAEEFARRRKAGEHLLANVLSKPRSFIVGNDDELGAMAQ